MVRALSRTTSEAINLPLVSMGCLKYVIYTLTKSIGKESHKSVDSARKVIICMLQRTVIIYDVTKLIRRCVVNVTRQLT